MSRFIATTAAAVTVLVVMCTAAATAETLLGLPHTHSPSDSSATSTGTCIFYSHESMLNTTHTQMHSDTRYHSQCVGHGQSYDSHSLPVLHYSNSTSKLIFHESESEAVYTSSSILRHGNSNALDSLRFVAAQDFRAPNGAEALQLDATQQWSYTQTPPSPEAILKTRSVSARHIDAPASGTVNTVVAQLLQQPLGNGTLSSTCTLMGFDDAATGPNAAPAWTYTVGACETQIDFGIELVAISDDGSTAALSVLANITNASGELELVAQLHAVDTATGKALFVHTVPHPTMYFLNKVSMSRKGEYVGYTVGQMAYIVQRNGTLRTPPFQLEGVYAHMTLCPMGVFIASGLADAHILMWNSTSGRYDPHFVVSGNGNWFVHDHAISVNGGGGHPDGCLVTVSWMRNDVLQVRLTLNALVSGKQFWDYQTPPAVSQYQNAAKVSMHLNYVAVALWGDVNPTTPNPQILLFDDQHSTPIASYTTPGSMYAVDVLALRPASRNTTGDDTVFFCASGKHYHANLNGDGGDSFALVYHQQA
jgi:hypothetical protein